MCLIKKIIVSTMTITYLADADTAFIGNFVQAAKQNISDYQKVHNLIFSENYDISP